MEKITARDVFSAAMGLIDELDSAGSAETADTKEYELRTPGLINMMIAEKRILSGEHDTFTAVTDISSELEGIEKNYALAVMQYGLAANLLVDENSTAAGFYQQRYEELRDRYILRQAASSGETERLYGEIEHGKYGRW